MKKLAILIFVAALVVGVVVANMFSFGRTTSRFFNFSFDIKGVKGSGNVASERREVADFHAIDVGGVYQVEVTAQKEFSVEVEADDNILPLVETRVENGTLYIESEQRVSPKSTIRVRISAPNIDDLDVSGAAGVTVNDLNNTALTIDSSGASKIAVGGKTSKLSIDVSGATQVDAAKLTAENVNVDASGASTVAVNVNGNLTAGASGASTITYAGSPKDVVKKTSGASSVSPR